MWHNPMLLNLWESGHAQGCGRKLKAARDELRAISARYKDTMDG